MWHTHANKGKIIILHVYSYDFGESTEIRNIEDRKLAVISRNQSDLNVYLHAILIRSCRSQIFKISTFFKGYIKCPYWVVLSSITLLRQLYIVISFLGINPLNPELNPICYLLALLAHHFLRVSRIRVKSLTLRLLMSYILYIYIYIYGAPILDVSRSHTTTQIVGSNPTGGMDICLLWVSCVVR